MSVVLDQESMAYPRHLLDGCSSGLLLFCSGRMGAADGHWFREAGLTDVTAVDWDEKTLVPFEAEYPDEWRYLQEDAWLYVAVAQRRWDIVSADPPSQYRDIQIRSLANWCSVSDRYVTATVMQPDIPDEAIPDGWTLLDVTLRAWFDDGRNYFWAVLQRT